MDKTVLIVLLDQYADWEVGFLAPLLQTGSEDENQPYWQTKIVSINNELIKSMGGLTVLPDMSVDDAPDRFDALILIGGMSWRKPEARRVIPLIRKAKEQDAILAAICDAANFIAWHGFLNDVKHTGNAGGDMQSYENTAYTNGAAFQKQERAVTDKRVITADGASPIPFTEHVLRALEIIPPAEIDEWLEVQALGEKAVYEPVD